MVRQGPEQSATEFAVGTKKRGNDKKMWRIVKTTSGVKRWQRITTTSKTTKRSPKKRFSWKEHERKWEERVKARKVETDKMSSTRSYIPKSKLTDRDRIYFIHDNGGRPYRVVANKKGITVFTYRDADLSNDIHFNKNIYTKEILHIPAKQIMGYWSGYDTSPYKMHGNTLLVQLLGGKEYIVINAIIQKFKTPEPIEDYISPVGNSDVPYPVAYGKENVYFILNLQYIPKEDLETPATVSGAEHLYREFYGLSRDKQKQHGVPLKGKKDLFGRRGYGMVVK